MYALCPRAGKAPISYNYFSKKRIWAESGGKYSIKMFVQATSTIYKPRHEKTA